MKYTNRHKFSPIVANWLKFDEYDYVPGVYSATTLLQPVRITVLKNRHWEEAEMDIEGLIASRYGTAIHDSFEKATINMEDVRQEERMFAEIDGVKVSGKFDQLTELDMSHFLLGDLKSTSVNAYIFGSNYDKWKNQLSIYRWLLSQQDEFSDATIFDIGVITMIFTDWNKKKAKDSLLRGDDYPQTRIMEKELDLWSLEETESALRDCVKEITEAEKAKDADLPRCPDEDLWRTPDKWAVYGGQAQKARRVLNTEEEAKEYVEEKKVKEARIEHRPGQVKRCKTYCAMWPWCNQYDEYKAQGLTTED